jgi:hypothetical protein
LVLPSNGLDAIAFPLGYVPQELIDTLAPAQSAPQLALPTQPRTWSARTGTF